MKTIRQMFGHLKTFCPEATNKQWGEFLFPHRYFKSVLDSKSHSMKMNFQRKYLLLLALEDIRPGFIATYTLSGKPSIRLNHLWYMLESLEQSNLTKVLSNNEIAQVIKLCCPPTGLQRGESAS